VKASPFSSANRLLVRVCTLIFLLSFAIRVAWVLIAPSVDPVFGANPLHRDGAHYDAIAQSLAAGRGFQEGGTPTAFRPPGYPFFLAFVYSLLGRDFLLVQVIQALTGAVTATLISYLGWQVGGKQVGFLAGMGAAVHPYLIYFTPWLVSEVLFLLLWVIGLLMLISLLQRWQLRTVALAAVSLGLATLVRPVSLLAVFLWGCLLLLLAIGQKKREHVGLGLAFTVISILTILPWTVRNYVVFDAFIPISTNGGYVFYGANNPDAMGGQREEFPPWLTELSEPQRDREYYRRALDWIRTDPGNFFKLLPKKLSRLWSPLSVSSFDEPLKTRFDPVIYPLWVAFIGFSAIGLILMTRHEIEAMLVLVIPLIATNITSLSFFGSTRYALPMVPSLILFAASALNSIVLDVLRRTCRFFAGIWLVFRTSR